jgi:U2 small nuclear ribonucleoprotein auxiliary factor 35 kDa subunit-related protein
LANTKFSELVAEEEVERTQEENNKKWLEREAEAQKIFNELKRKKEQIEKNQELERARIKAEFDAEKKKRQDLAAAKRQALEQEQKQIKLLLHKLNDYVAGIGEIPEEMTVTAQTNPGRDICPFFVKTASCRFGDRCSRNHSRPGVSKVTHNIIFFFKLTLFTFKYNFSCC